jgi:hypothetical protein
VTPYEPPLGEDDPAVRDEMPRCWDDPARGIPGAFFFADGVKPWNWIELDSEEAEKLWSLLAGFVAFVNARYGERPDRRVPPCWPEHGPIVEELTTLCFSRWHAFDSPHGSIDGAQRWHSQTLPSFYDRLASWFGDDLLACQQGRHRDRDDPVLESASSWVVRTEVIQNFDVEHRPKPTAPGTDATRVTGVAVPFLEVIDESAPVRIRNPL